MGTSSSTEHNSDNGCPLCRGAGFLHPRQADGKPDYGSITPCRCTSNTEAGRRRERLVEYSGLGALRDFTFEKLAPQGRSGNSTARRRFANAYNAARQFAAEPKGWLVFTGSVGSGKTHLAAAIANARLAQDAPVLFVTVADLLDHLRAAFAPDSNTTYDRLFNEVRNATLLILDDLGMQAGTPWAQEKLDQIISYRHSHALPTIFTAEKTVNQMDARLGSRLGDPHLSQVFPIDEEAQEHALSWPEGLELQKGMSFKKFDRRVNLPSDQRANLEAAYQCAMDFAQSPSGWLVFQGVTGAGKTHLAAAIVNFRYQEEKPATFVVVPDFLDHLRSTFSPDSKVSYDQLFEKVKTTPLLVLDDFGEQSATPWAQEKLYQVINYRYNAKLPTVVTTTQKAEHIDQRISSRFFDPKISMLFAITAPDFRTSFSAGSAGGGIKRTSSRRGRSSQ